MIDTNAPAYLAYTRLNAIERMRARLVALAGVLDSSGMVALRNGDQMEGTPAGQQIGDQLTEAPRSGARQGFGETAQSPWHGDMAGGVALRASQLPDLARHLGVTRETLQEAIRALEP